MAKQKIKAIGLLSGGLDSILATKIILDQGIEVVGLNFNIPFLVEGDRDFVRLAAGRFHIPLKVIELGADYLKIIRKPKYGYGSGLNPCLDCRIFILKKAKVLAGKIGAQFIFTGEVLGQRPMSQHRQALKLVAKEAGLTGKILRPLSAKLLAETEAEKRSWLVREKLLDISGRSRKRQIALAQQWKIKDYFSPAGGCLLTDKNFARKLRDLFDHNKRITLRDIEILKIGRHFRFGRNRIIIGRNKEENERLRELKNKSDYCFAVAKYPGPITLLAGPKTKRAVQQAAALTVSYSDAPEEEVLVEYGPDGFGRQIVVQSEPRSETTENRI